MAGESDDGRTHVLVADPRGRPVFVRGRTTGLGITQARGAPLTVGVVRRVRRAVRPLRPPVARALGSIFGVRTQDPVVAFTFDDGPHPEETPRILSVLADHRARATFFLIGERAATYPSLVHEIRAEGHEVALHGDRHDDLTKISASAAKDVISNGRRRLEQILGESVRLFRPPFGNLSVLAYLIAKTSGLEVIAWSAVAKDWLDTNLDEYSAIAMKRLRAGGILLAHEGLDRTSSRSRTRERMDRLLTDVEDRGWSVQTVSGLLRGRQPVRRIWFDTRGG